MNNQYIYFKTFKIRVSNIIEFVHCLHNCLNNCERINLLKLSINLNHCSKSNKFIFNYNITKNIKHNQNTLYLL